MPFEAAEFAPIRQIPDPGRIVAATCGQNPAVPGNGDIVDWRSVATEDAYNAAAVRVPKSRCTAAVRGDEIAAVRRNGNRIDFISLAAEAAHLLSQSDVPETGSRISATANQEVPAVRSEGCDDRASQFELWPQSPNALAGGDVPQLYCVVNGDRQQSAVGRKVQRAALIELAQFPAGRRVP